MLKKVTNKIIYLNSGMTLVGNFNKEQIKEDLTFKNPKYEQILKFSKYSNTFEPEFLFYYDTKKGKLDVPLGYNLSDTKVKIIDERVLNTVKFPVFKMDLRDTQKEAVKSFFNNNKTCVNNGCLQLPTGKGKTITAVYLTKELEQKTLIIVHKDDLVTGWREDIKKAFDNKIVTGLIKAKSRTIGDHITIATIQTLSKLSEGELNKLYNEFGLIILDEMHHVSAPTFNLVSNFNSRYKIGLTATPERKDGLGFVMNLYFGNFFYRYTANARDEDILSVNIKVRDMKVYFNPICKLINKKQQIVDIESEKCFNTRIPLCKGEKRLSDVNFKVRPTISFLTLDNIFVNRIKKEVCEDILKEYNLGKSCVVFFKRVKHLEEYRDYLLTYVPKEDIGLYYGNQKDNNSVKEMAENKRKFITLTTFSKSTEGTNVKQWEKAFLVSSLNDGKNTEQAVGRVRRTKEGCKDDVAVVYDYRSYDFYSLSKHGNTRDLRYRQLKFNIEGTKARTLFKNKI